MYRIEGQEVQRKGILIVECSILLDGIVHNSLLSNKFPNFCRMLSISIVKHETFYAVKFFIFLAYQNHSQVKI